MIKKYILKLFITGDTANSQRAVKTLSGVLEKEIKGLYELEIVDVLKHPDLAEQDKILATPTVVKVSPLPAKRIVGDLSAGDKVMSGLDLIDRSKQ